jgi:protein required for attachment to host cells
MKPIKTWALIADGARARILDNSGPGHSWTGVEGHVFDSDHAATHDLVSDREGRSFSSQGPGRSAIASHSDPHRELKTTFAVRLAGILADGLSQNAYERLIIAASPVMLGDLRQAISDKVRATIIGEFPHDLTKIPNSEIAAHLQPVRLA